jgi:drug/metabolite transporter (DMT)-like permease
MSDILEINEDKGNGFIIKKEGKSYLNFYFCQVNTGLIFLYMYAIFSSIYNVISRILFHNYKFTFNFTLFFFQQLICTIIFEGLRKKYSDLNIDVKTFLKNKYFYIFFAYIYMLNVLSVFYGNQLVLNVSMYFSLKKLTPLMLFFIDFYVRKKSLSWITILCIFLICGGSFLIAFDSFSKDYLGYAVVIISNGMSIAYGKLSEIYIKVTGYSNIKLLIYNNYLTLPAIVIGIFFTGEHKKLYEYIITKGYSNEGSFIGLVFFVLLDCTICSLFTLSFFISNEKNSSLITKLLSNTKGILVTTSLYLFDSEKNKLNVNTFFGLLMATCGSIFINIQSIYKNINKSDKKEKQKKINEYEMVNREEE